jgi:hypothetical protein
MARPPDGSQTRSVFVPIRLTPRGAAALDEVRRTLEMTRSAYIRKLIADDYERWRKMSS